MNKGLFTFCVKATLFVAVVCGADRMVGAAFKGMKDIGLRKNPENMWLKTAFAVEKVNADVVVIGSSSASHHYVPQMLSDSLNMTVYNCGQDGCFFLYQNCLINMMLDRYSPKKILWDIQPSSFTHKNAADEYQNIRYLSPYYHSNEWAKRYIDSESTKMPLRMMSNMFAYNSKVLNYVFPLVTHSAATQHGYIPLPNEGYAYPIYAQEKHTEGEVTAKYLALLGNTIKRCKEKGVDLHLYISPDYTEKSALTLTAEKEIEKVVEQENMHFANYHSAEAFMKNATYFKDAGHLNDKGAHYYTSLLLNDLRHE